MPYYKEIIDIFLEAYALDMINDTDFVLLYDPQK